jgi:hypothetical protein
MLMSRFGCMLLFGLAFFALPAAAADVVYPVGSRIGIIPPPGLTASTSFPGFEDREKNVALLVGALPREAFAQFEKSDSAEGMKNLGAKLERRESLALPSGKALLVIGRQEKQTAWMLVAEMPDLTATLTLRLPDAARDAYPETALRAAFASLVVRPSIPVEEQLGLLPFRLNELAGFKIGGVLAGRGIMLTDVAPGTAGAAVEPHMIVSVLPGTETQGGDRDDIARQIFRGIPNLKEVHITAAEQLRINGQLGHEIMAVAKDPATNTDLTLVQWLRFGGGAYLHLVGLAPTPAWTQAYARFRAVRDGVEPR